MPKKDSTEKELERIESELEHVEAELKEERLEEHAEFEKFEKKLEGIKVKPRIEEHFTKRDLARGLVGAVVGMSTIIWENTVWEIGASLSILSTGLILLFSLLGAAFVLVFSQFKRVKSREILMRIIPKRVAIFYLLSFVIVFFFMALFQINVLGETAMAVALKRVILVTFPAVMLASAADVI